MRKQILVIGCGRFGSAVARTLAEGGHEVVVADHDETALRPVMDEVAHAAVVDATDEVVRPEHDMGERLAHQIASPGIVDAFMLGDEHEVVEVEVGAQEAMHGRLKDLRLPDRFGVQVIAVNRGGELTVSPGAEVEIRDGDRVVVIGAVEAVRSFERELEG